LVHLEATEKSLKAQEEILKRQSRDLEGKSVIQSSVTLD
jgi:hypothetical protein